MNTGLIIGVMSFLGGCIVGILWKGAIDRKYDKIIQESLIRIGKMADDEIEEKNREIERLHETVTDLQIKLNS